MSDTLEGRVKKLEEDDSGCGCLMFLVFVVVMALVGTGHRYVIDNVINIVIATPTPGVLP